MHEHEINEYLEIALAEVATKPGTANVSPEDRKKLKGILAHYAKMPHPFTACKRDQMKHGLSESHAEKRCAVIKDLIRGNTHWRGKGKKEMSEEELAEIRLDIPEEFATWLNESSEQEIQEFIADPMEDKKGILRYIANLMGIGEDDAREDTGEAESGVGDVSEEAEPEEEQATPAVATLAYQLPYELSEAKPSGETPSGEKLYKKTLLRAGRSINYDDGKVKRALNFTDDFLKSMLSNLKAKAFDQIPLLSHHPKDPDKEVFAYLGELVDADIEEDRLVGTFKVTEKGDALLKDNPRLGTSVGYLEDWTRDDGEHFKGSVLQHVATTFKPRVNAPDDSWELVQMSDFGGKVVDLTEARYSVPTRKERGPVADDVQTPDVKEEEVKVETVELSDDAKQAIKLAQDQAAQMRTELDQYKELSQKTARELLEQKVERELDEYKLAGVPPAFIDRARPVLLAEVSSTEVEVIELSQEGVATKKNVSIAAQTRSMLDFMRGTVDLSEEAGRSDIDPETSSDEAQHQKIVALSQEKGISYREAMRELSSRGEVTL